MQPTVDHGLNRSPARGFCAAVAPYGLLPVLLLLIGCSSIRTELGHPLPEISEPLVEGQTRVDTVLRELGPPHKVSALPGGFAFLYEYTLVNEFQIGLSLNFIRMPYFKLVKADSHVSEAAHLLIFDQQGLLLVQDPEAWREKFGTGAGMQWVTAVQGLTDTSIFRISPEQLEWGKTSLERAPEALNRHSDLRVGDYGLQQRMSPVFAGQSTLEMFRPKPVKLKKSRRVHQASR